LAEKLLIYSGGPPETAQRSFTFCNLRQSESNLQFKVQGYMREKYYESLATQN